MNVDGLAEIDEFASNPMRRPARTGEARRGEADRAPRVPAHRGARRVERLFDRRRRLRCRRHGDAPALGHDHGRQATPFLYGEEINAGTYAICKGEFLLRGNGGEADKIVGRPKRSTLANKALGGAIS